MLPHLNAAFNLARWLVRSAQEAEDIVQDSYLRAFRAFESFRGGDARAWLLAIVRNTCYTALSRKGQSATVEFDERAHSGPDESETAETILLNRAALASLRDCLEALPAEFREVTVLRELEELPYKEIAEVARVPVGTVMSRLARARRRLQLCLAVASK